MSILNTIFKMSFERANKELFYSGIDITFSGATTVAILVIDNVLWCSNIGDSRAVNYLLIIVKDYRKKP